MLPVPGYKYLLLHCIYRGRNGCYPGWTLNMLVFVHLYYMGNGEISSSAHRKWQGHCISRKINRYFQYLLKYYCTKKIKLKQPPRLRTGKLWYIHCLFYGFVTVCYTKTYCMLYKTSVKLTWKFLSTNSITSPKSWCKILPRKRVLTIVLKWVIPI